MRRKRISGLEDHLGYWLRMVSNGVSLAFARKVEAAGVSVAEWVVLRQLFEAPPMKQSDLAARMGMTRGAISKLADRLGEKGLVARSGDAADARIQHLALTPRGAKLVPHLAALADQNEAEFFGGLSTAERRALQEAMRALAERAGLKEPPVS